MTSDKRGSSGVPEGWRKKTFGEVATLQRGFDLPQQDRLEGSFPIVSSGGITGFHNDFRAKAPGVVTGRYGTIGDLFFLEEDYWPLNTSLWVKDFHGNQERYIFYLLNTVDFKKLSDKTGVPGVNRNDVHKLETLLPPLEEQRKIAEILSAWDETIEQQTRLLELKRERKRGLMQQLLTGRVRFKEFTGLEWETVALEELVKSKAVSLGRGNVISKTDMENSPGDYPVYSSSVKKNGLFGTYGKYMFDEELITWSVDGGGNFFYRPKHRFSVTNVCGHMHLDSSRFNYRFVAAYLEVQHERLSFDYQSKAHPSVILKLYNLATPTLPEQQKIATVLSAADAELDTLTAQLTALKAQKRGMMQRLLTGKTRVRLA